MMAVVVGVMLVALLGVFAAFAVMRSSIVIGSYGLFPDSDLRGLRPGHYRDPATLRRSGSKIAA